MKEESNFFKVVSKMQTVLRLWRFVFKSLAILKTVFQVLIAIVPSHIIKALERIQTSFLWNNSNPKIKHKTICKKIREGCLKNADMQNKLTNSFRFYVLKAK